MLSLVVLFSDFSSSVRTVLEAANDAQFPARLVAMGTDRDAEEGLDYAEQHNIPTFTVPFVSFPDGNVWGEELLANIRSWEPDLVVMKGFQQPLPHTVVNELSPFLLSTHPAYLPGFPGRQGVRDALRVGVTETDVGVTVVNTTGEGPIIGYEKVPVLVEDTETTLHERIHSVEGKLLLQSILDIANGHINLRELRSS